MLSNDDRWLIHLYLVLKIGRVAIITRGRYAGKKVANPASIDSGLSDSDIYCYQVVIIQPLDSGSKTHPFPHALVAGIERYPSQITRRMSKTRQAKRSKVKPFIKTINYNHLMPTRYTMELEGLKGVVTNDTFKEVSQREDAKKTVKKALEERYTSGKNRWFFTALRELKPIGKTRYVILTITKDFEPESFEKLSQLQENSNTVTGLCAIRYCAMHKQLMSCV